MSAEPTLPQISELNSHSYDEFNSTVSLLFEPAPPLSKLLFANRPFDSYKALIDTAQNLTFSSQLSLDEKLQVINAHPRLGESKKTLSALSSREQGYATDNKNDENEEQIAINKKLQTLNIEYEAKYGFRFVEFVNGRSRKEIIPVFETRLREGSKEQEFNTGLLAMFEIARNRLFKMGGT